MLGTFALSLFLNSTTLSMFGVIFAICLLYKIWDDPSPSYIIRDGQLIIEDGTIVIQQERIELFRVKDISASSNLLLNLFKIGTITLFTTDKSCPKVKLKYIKNYKQMAENIRKEVLRAKKYNNTQEIDIE